MKPKNVRKNRPPTYGETEQNDRYLDLLLPADSRIMLNQLSSGSLPVEMQAELGKKCLGLLEASVALLKENATLGQANCEAAIRLSEAEQQNASLNNCLTAYKQKYVSCVEAAQTVVTEYERKTEICNNLSRRNFGMKSERRTNSRDSYVSLEKTRRI